MKWIPLEQKILQCTGMVCARCYILHNRLYLGFRSFGLCRIFSDLNKAPCSISIMWSVTVSITGQITVFSTYHGVLVNKNFTYVAKGGKTATADNPNGTRAKDKARVWISVSVGKPPPPAVPAAPPEKWVIFFLYYILLYFISILYPLSSILYLLYPLSSILYQNWNFIFTSFLKT